MPIRPWWVIALLPNDGDFSYSSFSDLLDKQLLTWSEANEIISSTDAHRWWAIDSFPSSAIADENELSKQIDQFLYNPLQRRDGQEPRLGGDIDGTQLSIAIIGDVRYEAARAYLHCLGRMLKLRQQELFGGMTLEILAFMYLPQDIPSQSNAESSPSIIKFFTELRTMMEHGTVPSRPFDFVFIQQDRNNTLDNRQGYNTITEGQVSELIVQSIFHLMIGGNSGLHNLRQKYNTHYFSMGAAALCYDWRKHRRELAKQLGEDLLDKFKSFQEEPFKSNEQAIHAVDDIEHETEIRSLFHRLVLGSDRPSFSFSSKIWEGARGYNGKVISPWALHRKELLYLYFLTHLRQLPLRLSEYARIFLRSSMQRFREFLQGRKHRVWNGDPEHEERGLREVIHNTVRLMLKGDFGSARSVEQVRNVLRQIKKACDPTKVDTLLARMDEFKQLRVFEVPDYLEEFYDKASDDLNPAEEERLYTRLVDKIRIHPIPLALFIRALLIAIMLAFLGDKALHLLSPQYINLEWLLRIPVLMQAILFVIPLVAALWRYQIRTLNEIQKRIKTYVGAVLRHAQTRAKGLVVAEMSALLDQAIGYCDQIEDYFNKLKDKLVYQEVETRSYVTNTFQRGILDTIEVPGRDDPIEILPEKPRYEIDIRGQKKVFEDCDNLEKNSLLSDILDLQAQDAPARYLWELLCDEIPEELSEASLDKAKQMLRQFTENMYEDVEKSSIHGLLLNPNILEYIKREITQKMKCLCFPPIVFSQGVVSIQPTYEWKYGHCDSIQVITDSCVLTNVPDTSLLSLVAYRPLGSLQEIAVVRAISMSTSQDDIPWSDASSVFAIATTEIPNKTHLALISALDGGDIQISDEEIQRRVVDLRRSLGLMAGKSETDYEI